MPESVPCLVGCQGQACELVEVGDGQLPQSGNTVLPAKRYGKPDCPRGWVEMTLATGERWRARP